MTFFLFQWNWNPETSLRKPSDDDKADIPSECRIDFTSSNQRFNKKNFLEIKYFKKIIPKTAF